MSSPIELVNRLQELVSSVYAGDEVLEPLQLYKAKHTISERCMALLRAVLGPAEYTAILAGMGCI